MSDPTVLPQTPEGALQIDLAVIEAAAERIKPHIYKTPILESPRLNDFLGYRFLVKAESLQHTGSFKYRAAINAITNIPSEYNKSGIITHSSGNFAHALAKASSELNIPCHVVMPSNTPKFKKSAVKLYTNNIIECESNLKAREFTLNKILKERKLYFIHPSNNMDVILGNSTCATEFIEDQPNLNYIFSPIGGGGLIAGTSLSIKKFSKNCKVIGAEPSNVDDAYRSLISGKIEKNITTNTIADGLRTNLGSNEADLRSIMAQVYGVNHTAYQNFLGSDPTANKSAMLDDAAEYLYDSQVAEKYFPMTKTTNFRSDRTGSTTAGEREIARLRSQFDAFAPLSENTRIMYQNTLPSNLMIESDDKGFYIGDKKTGNITERLDSNSKTAKGQIARYAGITGYQSGQTQNAENFRTQYKY